MDTNPLHTVKEIKVISSAWADRAGEKKVNELLNTGEWIIIGTSSGNDRDGYPVHEWVVGKIR